ncbi:MAG: FAD-dependent monooxygenase, partial [Candidatus Acidiferrales bacterium]
MPEARTESASRAASPAVSRATSRERDQKVAVVGGSAAGLLTATVLARQGVDVRVFERIETLDHPERTLIVTNRMRTLLGRAAEGSIVNEIRRFELFTDGRSATFELKQPDLIIERRALIQG